ncbi:hypothetical protein FRC08_013616, partial [Ceratobasidium sp. 394]
MNLTYGTGRTSGYVGQTSVAFGGNKLFNQSFLVVQDINPSDVSCYKELPLCGGMAGLGFDTNSEINYAVYNATSDTW